MLDRVDPRLEHDHGLLDLGFLLVELAHLLLQERYLVDVHRLHLPEILLQVRDVLQDLLQRVIGRFVGLVLEGSQF